MLYWKEKRAGERYDARPTAVSDAVFREECVRRRLQLFLWSRYLKYDTHEILRKKTGEWKSFSSARQRSSDFFDSGSRAPKFSSSLQAIITKLGLPFQQASFKPDISPY